MNGWNTFFGNIRRAGRKTNGFRKMALRGYGLARRRNTRRRDGSIFRSKMSIIFLGRGGCIFYCFCREGGSTAIYTDNFQTHLHCCYEVQGYYAS